MASKTEKNAFAQEVVEALRVFGTVSTRAMFGAHGLFHQGLMIGIVEDGKLFLKVNAQTQPRYEAAGCEPFTYPGADGQLMRLGYWRVPPEVLEQPPVLATWAREAYDVAVQAKAPKPKTSRAKKSSPPTSSPV